VIPERIIFVSRGITVYLNVANWFLLFMLCWLYKQFSRNYFLWILHLLWLHLPTFLFFTPTYHTPALFKWIGMELKWNYKVSPISCLSFIEAGTSTGRRVCIGRGVNPTAMLLLERKNCGVLSFRWFPWLLNFYISTFRNQYS